MSIEIITPLDTRLQQLETDLQQMTGLARVRQDEIEQLRVELETLKQAISSDSTLLSDTLITEANEREWCEVYDQIVDGLNRQFKVIVIDERKSDFEVEVEITGTVRATTWVNVTARTREEAEYMVSRDYDGYINGTEILEETISCNGFDNIEMEIA